MWVVHEYFKMTLLKGYTTWYKCPFVKLTSLYISKRKHNVCKVVNNLIHTDQYSLLPNRKWMALKGYWHGKWNDHMNIPCCIVYSTLLYSTVFHLFYIFADPHVYAMPENYSSEKNVFTLHFYFHISPYLFEIRFRMNITGARVGWWRSTAL